ncbi:MAG: PBP1A family penicillin-binding protein [Armatimonadetes bacterium]|nr:PBP1A family penicillin-binding protein [Armatimonadota bacterium]
MAWNIFKVAFLLAIAGVLGLAGATFYSISKLLPSGDEIVVTEPPETTRIYASDGSLLARIYQENRESADIAEIPKVLQDATVAIEDSRFYTHAGLDAKAIVRALYENIRGGRWAQGGSTITQQLARNIFLSQRKTVSRKLQELLLAREIERRLSKEEILQRYLNTVFYGSGAHGVKAAARVYFGKLPAQLTLAEAALLAGLPQRPSRFSPYEDEDAAVNRRDVVLNRMAELGYITRAAAEDAKKTRPKLVGIRASRTRVRKGPHFVAYVVSQLVNRWGPEQVYGGGLRVYTTLNTEMQEAAERALARQVKVAQGRGKKVGQGCFVAIDPQTGHIKAMVGSLDYYDKDNKGEFNRVVQARRQPGSAFKPFVYTAAFDSGYRPDDTLVDSPLSFPDGKNTWRPGNYDGRFRGRVTLRRAVEMSINIPAIRMIHTLGVDTVIAYAHRMGIKSPLGRDLSLAIGTSVVSPLELASAYGCFATNGVHAEPMVIARVLGRDDRVMEDNRPVLRRAIPTETAETMADVLRGVVTRGTGTRAGAIEGACGKTGTTQNDRDAWFVGFTRDLVAAVWVGNDDDTPMGGSVFGGTVCAPAWASFMETALPIVAKARRQQGNVAVARAESEREHRTSREERQRIREELRENTVIADICPESGVLAVPGCPVKKRMGFPRGGEPRERCPIHGSYSQPLGGQPLESPDTGPAAVAAGAHLAPEPASGQPARPGGAESGGAAERREEVTICVQSQKRANEYCPEVVIRRLPAAQVPGICAAHGPAASGNGVQ